MNTGPASRRLALAIDIGGTNIKGGIITRDGELLTHAYAATPARTEPETVVRELLGLVKNLCEQSGTCLEQLDGIGVSMAAFVTADGKVTATAHLSREWIGYNLKTRLAADLPLEAYFSLDTPAPTLGEFYYGAGRGIADLAYVTVSTGVGAGIIVQGKYFTGGLGWAGGVGHIIIDENSPHVCEGCRNHGCLETFAAKQGILATTRELAHLHPESLIWTLSGGRLAAGSLDAVTPQMVCQAAQAGDPTAIEVFRRAGHALGLGLISLADIVAPSRIVVGGGIARAGELLLGPARRVIQERAFPPRIREVEVVQAALGDLSGIYGAAAMVFYDLRINSPIDG
jgi:glucokinase